MRTTVNIDDAFLAEARQRAARERRDIGSIINEALRENFARRKAKAPLLRKERLITFRGNGVRPGVHLDCMSELLDIMDGTK
jgi:Arc/MetJ family transcription regulator